jgi:hypothetical protein
MDPPFARASSGGVRTWQVAPDVDLRRQARFGFIGCRGAGRHDCRTTLFQRDGMITPRDLQSSRSRC